MNTFLQKIKRNSKDFSFVDTIGSFINNYEFSEGYRSMQTGVDDKRSYIWNVLSAIGNEYADTIYENVLNYIDNASNVDLCKIKALQSMIQVLGVKYQILDSYSEIPVEIANLMDILSINKSYILRSDIFKKSFIQDLSANKCIIQTSYKSTLSDYLRDSTVISSSTPADTLSSSNGQIYTESKLVIDQSAYKEYLINVYNTILKDFVYMQYADAEAGLSTQYEYIWQYISETLLDENSYTENYELTTHDAEIKALKLKYKIDKDFDQSQIVDNIEEYRDSIDNYNIYEQKVIEAEMEFREQTYSYNSQTYSSEKTYQEFEKSLGYNITRYSYYREKKVREYVNFIQSVYNNLVVESNFKNGMTDDLMEVYDKDNQYFNIKQSQTYQLIEYDSGNNELYINDGYILDIAKHLAEQTLNISDIREQLKIQMQKNYMRGTFLLITYIVNEFLKYNIGNKYGDYFSAKDTGVSLKTFIDRSISNDNNVQLIEYFDDTEYFNITRNTDDVAKNGETANEKYWDTTYSKVGQITQDIPLEEIENFYNKILKLENRNVDVLADFLSAVFEYGANTSYINNSTLSSDWMNYGDFVCQIKGGRFIGDPDGVIQKIEGNINVISAIESNINEYTSDGVAISSGTILEQIDKFKVDVSSYYANKISSTNSDQRNEILDKYTSALDTGYEYSDNIKDLSTEYEELKINEKYEPYYLYQYQEIEPAYFKQKICNFHLSVISENGIQWNNLSLQVDLTYLLNQYIALSGDLYNKLFELSVWPTENSNGVKIEYWPYYRPDFDAELTSNTNTLASYLMAQADIEKEKAIQHIQNHYDKLLTYKNEINEILTECNIAIGTYEEMRAGIEAASGTSMDKALTQTVPLFIGPVYECTWKWNSSKKEDGGYYEQTVTDKYRIETESFYSEAINSSDTLSEKLYKLQQRAHYKDFSQSKLYQLDALEESDQSPDENTYFTTRTAKNYHYTIVTGIDDPEKTVYYEYYYVYTYKYADQLGYFESDAKQPWFNCYSQQTADSILAKLNNAIANLNNTITLINSELVCLRGDNYKISIPSSTEDTIQSDTKTVYNTLVEKLDEIDNWVKIDNKWAELSSDSGNYTKDLDIYVHCKKLQRIRAINDDTPIAYNCRYIEVEWNKINLSIELMLTKHAAYFDEYSHSYGQRLDEQIRSMSAYMVDRDASAKEEVAEMIIDISARYEDILKEFLQFASGVTRDEVKSINDDYSYNIDQFNFPMPAQTDDKYQYIDYMLYGDYIYASHTERLSGLIYWIPEIAQTNFIQTEAYQIYQKIPQLPEYIATMQFLDLASTKYLAAQLSSTDNFVEKLGVVKEWYYEQEEFIESQIPTYNKNYEIYLKYNGTDIGYDPFYNHKNLAYSSYQIHPYLYNFVEGSNIIQPLANSFYLSFSEEYESNLYKKTIDDIIGKFGNVINLWKYGMFDWTSYQTEYEHYTPSNKGQSSPMFGYDGLFYPPALSAFLANTSKFIQDVQDNNEDSYYYHLNLTQSQCERIALQLQQYEDAIRLIAQKPADQSFEPALSTEFDIYKYAVDNSGNSLILLKSYQYLYEQHAGQKQYVPSYNEKKDAPGELWMRIKDHPLALPAFDTIDGSKDLSQYSIENTPNTQKQNINEYIKTVNEWFGKRDQSSESQQEICNITLDSIGRTTTTQKKQNLRCFVDMELSPEKKCILLVVPYATGGSNNYTAMQNSYPYIQNFSYANSSIIISKLSQAYDSKNAIIDYNFTSIPVGADLNSTIDNIQNPGLMYTDSTGSRSTYRHDTNVKYEFVGFAKYNYTIFTVYIKKYVTTKAFTLDKTTAIKCSNPVIVEVLYYYYKYGNDCISKHAYSDDIKYDVFSTSTSRFIQNVGSGNRYSADDYKYANYISLACSSKVMSICYLSQRVQDSTYSDNTTIVNFAEYTAMVEDRSDISSYGQNTDYPRSTALLQTDDSQHLNIYNSFDSFVQHIVTLNFNLSEQSLAFDNCKIFNLDTDIGFLPLFQNKVGTTRLNNNTALKNNKTYKLELLGPEQTDIQYTPIIVTPTDENYGRVTEDYKAIDQFSSYISDELSIAPYNSYVDYHWHLSSILSLSTYLDFQETNELHKYRYMLINNRYKSLPILKGILSAPYPTEYYYMSSESYDLLSGQDIIGPNGISYQDVNMTNHINNISGIQFQITYNQETLLPENIHMSCCTRLQQKQYQVIEKDLFSILVYKKNSLNSYDFYRLIENADQSKSSQYMTKDEDYQTDFKQIVELSSYEINGKYPFQNYGLSSPLQMSALLQFKYSEEELVNREFPYLNTDSINDDITLVETNENNIYYFQVDDANSLSVHSFYMDRYFPSSNEYGKIRIDPLSKKYVDFFGKALQIQAHYNLERIYEDQTKYGIVLYFNYRNYTNPTYIDFLSSKPPKASVYESTAKEIEDTYLQLNPGQSGKLDIRIEYLFYDKLKQTDIMQTVVGHKVDVLTSYYILNVSDNKPKFILSRKPFQKENEDYDFNNYEMADEYSKGVLFRYFRIQLEQTRTIGASYVSFSRLRFYNKKNSEYFEFPDDVAITYENLEIVPGKSAQHLLESIEDISTMFLGTNLDYTSNKCPILTFDMKTKCFDPEIYTKWFWWNAYNSKSHQGFMPKKFKLEFSNDKKTWYTACEYNDYNSTLKTNNCAKQPDDVGFDLKIQT